MSKAGAHVDCPDIPVKIARATSEAPDSPVETTWVTTEARDGPPDGVVSPVDRPRARTDHSDAPPERRESRTDDPGAPVKCPRVPIGHFTACKNAPDVRFNAQAAPHRRQCGWEEQLDESAGDGCDRERMEDDAKLGEIPRLGWQASESERGVTSRVEWPSSASAEAIRSRSPDARSEETARRWTVKRRSKGVSASARRRRDAVRSR